MKNIKDITDIIRTNLKNIICISRKYDDKYKYVINGSGKIEKFNDKHISEETHELNGGSNFIYVDDKNLLLKMKSGLLNGDSLYVYTFILKNLDNKTLKNKIINKIKNINNNTFFINSKNNLKFKLMAIKDLENMIDDEINYTIKEDTDKIEDKDENEINYFNDLEYIIIKTKTIEIKIDKNDKNLIYFIDNLRHNLKCVSPL